MANHLSHLRVTEHGNENDLINPVYKKGQQWAFDMPDTDVDVHTIFTSETLHTINVCNTEHGTIYVNAGYAIRGSVITVHVTPDIGYRTDSCTCTGAEMVPGEIPGTYTFTMPNSAVTVCAVFEEGVESDATVAEGSDCLKVSTTESGEWFDTIRAVEGRSVFVKASSGNRIMTLSVVSEGGTHVQCLVDGGTATFTMPGENVTVTGTCSSEAKQYRVNLSDSITGGAVEPSPWYYDAGEVITVSLFPTGDTTADIALYKDSGIEAREINLDGVPSCHSERSGTVTGPGSDITVYASFGGCRPNKNQHKITVNKDSINGGCDEESLMEIHAWATKEKASEGEIIKIGWNSDVCCEYNDATFTPQNVERVGGTYFIMPDRDVDVTIHFRSSDTHRIYVSRFDLCELEGVEPIIYRNRDHNSPLDIDVDTIWCGQEIDILFFGVEETLVLTDLKVIGERTNSEIYYEMVEAENESILYRFTMPSENVYIRYCFGSYDPEEGGGGDSGEEYYDISTVVIPEVHNTQVSVRKRAQAGSLVTVSFAIDRGEKPSVIKLIRSNGTSEYLCSGSLQCEREILNGGNRFTFVMPRCDVIVYVELMGSSSEYGYDIVPCSTLFDAFEDCECVVNYFSANERRLSDLNMQGNTGFTMHVFLKRREGNERTMVTAKCEDIYIPIYEKEPYITSATAQSLNCGGTSGESARQYVISNFREFEFIMPADRVTICQTTISEGDKSIYMDESLFDVIRTVKADTSTVPECEYSGIYEKCYGPVSEGSVVTVVIKPGYRFVSDNSLMKVWILDDEGNRISDLTAESDPVESDTIYRFTMPSNGVYLDWYAVSVSDIPSCSDVGTFNLTTDNRIRNHLEYGYFSKVTLNNERLYYAGSGSWDRCIQWTRYVTYEFETIRSKEHCDEGTFCKTNDCPITTVITEPKLYNKAGEEIETNFTVDRTPFKTTVSFIMPNEDCTFNATVSDSVDYAYILLQDYLMGTTCEGGIIKVWDKDPSGNAPLLDSTNTNKLSAFYRFSDGETEHTMHVSVTSSHCCQCDDKFYIYRDCDRGDIDDPFVDIIYPVETVTEGDITTYLYDFNVDPSGLAIYPIGSHCVKAEDFEISVWNNNTHGTTEEFEYECCRYGDDIYFTVHRNSANDVYDLQGNVHDPYKITVLAEYYDGREHDATKISSEYLDDTGSPTFNFVVEDTRVKKVVLTVNCVYNARVLELRNNVPDGYNHITAIIGETEGTRKSKILLPDSETEIRFKADTDGVIASESGYCLSAFNFNTHEITFYPSLVSFGIVNNGSDDNGYIEGKIKIRQRMSTDDISSGIVFEADYEQYFDTILIEGFEEDLNIYGIPADTIEPSKGYFNKLTTSGRYAITVNGSNLDITVPEIRRFIDGAPLSTPICGVKNWTRHTYSRQGMTVRLYATLNGGDVIQRDCSSGTNVTSPSGSPYSAEIVMPSGFVIFDYNSNPLNNP